MTIEVTKLDSINSFLSRSADAATAQTPKKTALAADTSTTTVVDASVMNDAAQQIQGHLSGVTDPPQFKVDYLSGLDVMTVRAASTGEVVFQIPGNTAVQLAQLIKEGAPVDSLGVLNTTA